MSIAGGWVLGVFIGAAVYGLGYLINGEVPPGWAVLLGTAVIAVPAVIWANSKNQN